MDVRKARLTDVDSIVSMWREFIGDFGYLVKKNPKLRPYIMKKKNAHLVFRKYVKKIIRSRNGIIFIAEDGKTPAGYCLCKIEKNIPVFSLEKFGCISDLYVREKYRNIGLSSAFRKEAFSWFRKKGMKHASIKTNVGNSRARGIYRKWGFHEDMVDMWMRIEN